MTQKWVATLFIHLKCCSGFWFANVESWNAFSCVATVGAQVQVVWQGCKDTVSPLAQTHTPWLVCVSGEIWMSQGCYYSQNKWNELIHYMPSIKYLIFVPFFPMVNTGGRINTNAHMLDERWPLCPGVCEAALPERRYEGRKTDYGSSGSGRRWYPMRFEWAKEVISDRANQTNWFIICRP